MAFRVVTTPGAPWKGGLHPEQLMSWTTYLPASMRAELGTVEVSLRGARSGRVMASICSCGASCAIDSAAGAEKAQPPEGANHAACAAVVRVVREVAAIITTPSNHHIGAIGPARHAGRGRSTTTELAICADVAAPPAVRGIVPSDAAITAHVHREVGAGTDVAGGAREVSGACPPTRAAVRPGVEVGLAPVRPVAVAVGVALGCKRARGHNASASHARGRCSR